MMQCVACIVLTDDQQYALYIDPLSPFLPILGGYEQEDQQISSVSINIEASVCNEMAPFITDRVFYMDRHTADMLVLRVSKSTILQYRRRKDG